MAEKDKDGTETTSEGGLERLLGDLRALSGDIESCAVLSRNGELLGSSHGPGVDRERVTAMLGALAGLAGRAAQEEGKRSAAQVRVKTAEGHLLMVGLGDGGRLVATTSPEARVGLVLYDMRNARGGIEEAAKEGSKP